MEINLDLLSIQNPWWRGAGLKNDPLVKVYQESPLEIIENIINNFDLEKDHIYSVRGARGLGKSTIIKILINDLIENKKINPHNILYYSCQNIDTYEQLNEIIKIFLNNRKIEKESRIYIFIDEVTLVKNWEKGIEFLKQAGRLKNITLFLVGSTLYNGDDKKNRNRVSASVLKKTKTNILTSLNFVDFIKLLNPEFGHKVISDNKQSGDKKIKFVSYFKNFDYYLDIYCLTGGYISSIIDFKDHGNVNREIYSNYLYWLIGDIAKMKRDVSLLRHIMEQILLNLGKPIGYKTIARNTKAKTHLTVEEYLNILESMLSVKLVYQSDLKGSVHKSKAKKVYFRDPFLFWLYYSYIYGAIDHWQFSREHLHKEDVYLALIENVIFSHLIKDESIEDWGKRITFWRDNIHKQEIDFLVNSKKKTTPILIRYNKEIEEKDYKMLEKNGFKKGVIISRDVLKLDEKIKIVPLAYFLLYYKDFI